MFFKINTLNFQEMFHAILKKFLLRIVRFFIAIRKKNFYRNEINYFIFHFLRKVS